MAAPSGPLSTSSAVDAKLVLGRTEPRLWTPPLVDELTPETSFGFEVIDFYRDVLEAPLDPWEEWAVIHAGELQPCGPAYVPECRLEYPHQRPRFKIVIILVARQNGKTFILVGLSLYWLFVERVGLVLGTSTKLEYAAESWKKACRMVRRVPDLWAEIPRKGGIRTANGFQELWRADEVERILDEGSRYKIAAANDDAGRSLTIEKGILDELRQHHDYSAWSAFIPALSAPHAQAWALSNAGSDKSVVLNEQRESALEFIETGIGDPRVGLFEYSAPQNAAPDDVDALAQANPNLGRRRNLADLLAMARTAMKQGGDALASYKTEYMCIRVHQMDPAFNMDNWARPAGQGGCLDPGSLEGKRDRVAMCVEVSEDGLHATLYAGAKLDDDRVRVDPVKAWSGPDEMRQLKPDLDKVLTQLRPRALGWLPNGPAAAIAADLVNPPKNVTVEAIRSEVTAVCMGFAKRIDDGSIAHSDDPLLNAHLEGSEKQEQGDAWRIVRRGAGHVDAAYAAAGAVHLALTVPAAPRPRMRVIDTRVKQQQAPR